MRASAYEFWAINTLFFAPFISLCGISFFSLHHSKQLGWVSMTLQWNTKFLKFKLFNDDTTSFAAYLLILSSWVDSSFPSFSHLTSIICIICSDCDIFSLTWNVIVFSSNNFPLSFSWPQSRDELTYLFSKTSWYFLCLHSMHSS